MVKYIEFFALHSQPEPVKSQVEHRCGIECQQLADDESADNSDPKRPPELGPVPVPKASGSAPKRAAMVVIRIGRKRSIHASKMASAGPFPSCRSAWRAKSIIMMAFFLTMPMSSTMPMMEITLRSTLKSIRASMAPTPADGRVEMIVSGMHQAFVKNPEHDVDGQQRGHHQDRHGAQRLLVGQQRARKKALDRGRGAELLLHRLNASGGLAQERRPAPD